VVARELDFGDRNALDESESLVEEVSKMLTAFIHTLRGGAKKGKLIAEG
jgi:hypothetical protein